MRYAAQRVRAHLHLYVFRFFVLACAFPEFYAQRKVILLFFAHFLTVVERKSEIAWARKDFEKKFLVVSMTLRGLSFF